MVIEGKTNLERTKRALISYTVYCAQNALRADEKTTKDYWDPEMKATDELIKAVDVNLERINEINDTPFPSGFPPKGGIIPERNEIATR